MVVAVAVIIVRVVVVAAVVGILLIVVSEVITATTSCLYLPSGGSIRLKQSTETLYYERVILLACGCTSVCACVCA